MKTIAFILILIQLALIGFSVSALAGLFGAPTASSIGIHVACIIANLGFGAMNFRTAFFR